EQMVMPNTPMRLVYGQRTISPVLGIRLAGRHLHLVISFREIAVRECLLIAVTTRYKETILVHPAQAQRQYPTWPMEFTFDTIRTRFRPVKRKTTSLVAI